MSAKSKLPYYWPDETKTPRPGQLEAIDSIIDLFKSKQYVLLNAPPGCGKSIIAMALGNYYAKSKEEITAMGLNSEDYNSYVLTTEKILQRQYFDDFSHVDNVHYLLGKNNYYCNREDLEQETLYENGICHMLPDDELKKLTCVADCPYKNARRLARTGEVVISNYHYMLIDQDFLSEFSKMPKKHLTIYDEAHNLESVLLDYTVVSISKKLVEEYSFKLEKASKFLNCPLPSTDSLESAYNVLRGLSVEDLDKAVAEFEKVYFWYKSLTKTLEKQIKISMDKLMKEYVKEGISLQLYKDDKYKKLKYCLNFTELLKKSMSKIFNMIESVREAKEIWIFDKNKDNTVFELKPVFASNLFKNTLNQLSNKKLFMSGTLCDKEAFCKTFNVDPDDVGYLSLPSLFPVENRKIFNLSVCDMGYKTLQQELSNCVQWVDMLVDLNKDKKIMIHSGNYNITDFIGKNSKHRDKMFIPQPNNRLAVVEEFKKCDAGILISPSLMEGLSLDYDLCRVQIILKIPYLSLADRRIKIRTKLDPVWYRQSAISKLIQSCGRGVRHSDDYCVTYVLDSCFTSLIKNSRNQFPDWYFESIKNVDNFQEELGGGLI